MIPAAACFLSERQRDGLWVRQTRFARGGCSSCRLGRMPPAEPSAQSPSCQKRERVAHTRMYEPPSQELRQVRANACRISESTAQQLLCRLVRRRDFLKFLSQRLGISQPICGPLNQSVISPHTSVANQCSEIHHMIGCGVLEYRKIAENVTADQQPLSLKCQDSRKSWRCEHVIKF